MPKSQIRKKKVYTPPADLTPGRTTAAANRPSPVWVPALAIAFFVIGVAWLVVFYLSGGLWPVESLRYWNLGIGFGSLIACLLVFSKWR
ncbi:cell division protein CrgA [Longispora albida]|uniref:cell division protein CrgA n=1 Tax=Longispora albida TaxID=203523 RepID=UPI000375BE37|nr:cell division protein CrgA [Longispora albida]